MGLVVAAGFGACQPDADPDPLDAVRGTIDALIAADNAGDLDAIASYYAEDGVLIPPSGAPVQGRSIIRARYAEGFERFRLRVTLYEEGARASGGLAFSRGTTRGEYVWRDGSPPTPFADRYLLTLRQIDGEWKVAVLMWSPAGSSPPGS